MGTLPLSADQRLQAIGKVDLHEDVDIMFIGNMPTLSEDSIFFSAGQPRTSVRNSSYLIELG